MQMKLHERGLAMSKILIVEDEESIADIEKDYLELNGYEVVSLLIWKVQKML